MAHQNRINNYLPFLDSLIALPGAKAINCGAYGIGAGGPNFVYTVPTGKRAAVGYAHGFSNSGAAGTCSQIIRVSSTNYTINTNISYSASNLAFLNQSMIILEAGEQYGYTLTGANPNCFTQVIEFDNTAPLRTYKNLALTSGDNTLYTVPAGKTAYPIKGRMGFSAAFNVGAVQLITNNGTMYHVPNGGSKGSNNQMSISTATTSQHWGSMNAGDFIVVNVGSTAGFGWINVVEV